MGKLQNEACKTFDRIVDGVKIYKDKKKYKTFEEALQAARNMNKNPNQIHKMQAYKCKTCLRFHIGRTYDELHTIKPF